MVLVIVFNPACVWLQIVVTGVEGPLQRRVYTEVFRSRRGGTSCDQRARRGRIRTAVDCAGDGINGDGGRGYEFEPPVHSATYWYGGDGRSRTREGGGVDDR